MIFALNLKAIRTLQISCLGHHQSLQNVVFRVDALYLFLT